MFDYDEFRVNLILHRKNLKMTQEELCDLADISTKNLGRIELGKQNPNIQTIISILNAFNTTLSSFMGYVNNDKDIMIDSINGYLEQFNENEIKFVLKLINDVGSEG